MFSEKTVHSDKIFRGRVFDVEVLTVQLHDGRPAKREIVRHNGGACIVAMDENRQIYMVRQFRKPYDEMLLEIPAGKLEIGEDPAECAKRELTEETGLTAAKIEWLTTMYPSPGYCSETLTIFLATGLAQGEAHPEEGEHLICQRMPLDVLLQMIDRGEIRDAKTQVGIMALDRRLREDR